MTNDDAIEILKNIQGYIEETLFLDRCAIDMAIEALKEKRPHGRWVDNHNGTFTCTECGVKHSKSNYCPNCGSDMQ